MTEHDSKPVVVLGARGGIGGAIVAELVRQGRPVRAVVRRAGAPIDGAEQVVADILDRAALRSAVAGASTIHFAAQPAYTRWPEEFPAMLDAVIGAAESAGAVLVLADNLYMYGPAEGPLSEATPMRATSRKGRTRRAMHEALFAAHAAGRVRATAGRAADYHGPRGVGSTLGERIFPAILAGKNVQWFGSLDVPRSVSFLPDIARALVTLGDRPEAWGRPWHIPAAPAVPMRDFFALAYREAGTSGHASVMGRAMLRLGGIFVPEAREIIEILDQFDRPFVVDGSAFEAAFGPFAPTPHDQALRTTLEWWRTRGASGR